MIKKSQKTMRLYKSACTIFLLSLAALAWSRDLPDDIQTHPLIQFSQNGYIAIPTEDSVFFGGEINSKSVDALIQVLEQERLKRGNRWLTIASGGGDVDAAMSLGRYLYKQKINVSVAGTCQSACAAFVLPAGFLKVIENPLDIQFHRGSRSSPEQSRQDIAFAMDSLEKKLFDFGVQNVVFDREDFFAEAQKIREEEVRYFEEIGINRDYNSCYLSPEILEESEVKSVEFWSYSRDALTALGISKLVIDPHTSHSQSVGEIISAITQMAEAAQPTIAEVTLADNNACQLQSIVQVGSDSEAQSMPPRINTLYRAHSFYEYFSNLLNSPLCTNCGGIQGLRKNGLAHLDTEPGGKIRFRGPFREESIHNLTSYLNAHPTDTMFENLRLDRESARQLGRFFATTDRNIEITYCDRTCQTYFHVPYSGKACAALRNFSEKDVESNLYDRDYYIKASRLEFLTEIRRSLEFFQATYNDHELEILADTIARKGLERYTKMQAEQDLLYRQAIATTACK